MYVCALQFTMLIHLKSLQPTQNDLKSAPQKARIEIPYLLNTDNIIQSVTYWALVILTAQSEK